LPAKHLRARFLHTVEKQLDLPLRLDIGRITSRFPHRLVSQDARGETWRLD
jgi:hypothetical protein